MNKILIFVLFLISLLPIRALAGTCNPPYDMFSTNCTNQNFSLSNVFSLQPINVDLGGGNNVVRYDQVELTSIGYGICNEGGTISYECVTGLLLEKVKNIFSGTTSQYVRGDGTLSTFPVADSRTFNYPSRTLNSCFQISSTKDADFHYKVDVTGSLNLTAGTTGTVTATSYTNSGCTIGAQAVADGVSAQSGTLIVGLGITQAMSVGIDGTLPTGKWIKLTTANTVGTPTFAIRAVQSEVIQP